MRLIAIIGLAVYLGIGAMLHALFVGPHFDWSSAWTFGWLLGWPIAVMVGMFAFALAISAIMFPVIWFEDWRDRRQTRLARAARRQQQGISK